MKKKAARRGSQLTSRQRDRIDSFGYFFAWLIGLVVVAGTIWFAQGPLCHSKVIQAHRQFRDRTAVVVSESTVLSGGYYGDHRAVTVRYTNWNGNPSTWQFLSDWRTQVGQSQHLIIDRRGVLWAAGDLEDRGGDIPLKPSQLGTIMLGVVIGLVLGIVVGVATFFLVLGLGTFVVPMKRSTPSRSGA